MGEAVKSDEVSAWYSKKLAVRDVTLEMKPNKVTALIGPSGCGKSTFLRCINRMHEVIPGARVGGDLWVGGQNIYGTGVDPVRIRAHIGMVFQRPNPFPTMSIYNNVASGPKLNRIVRRGGKLDALVEHSLRRAALWDEVKDRL